MNTTPANYYDNINTTLLGMVDPSAQRIAEFGCGAGGLSRAIRKRCPEPVHYVGVELVADELAKAHDTLDISLVRNLDQVPVWAEDAELLQALPLGTFDHVIFGDVLEHLYTPEKVLKQAVDCLRPGGSALVCIPNVQHWGVMAQWLKGHWPRHDSGLFDRTHIRWFALRDMVHLLQSVGLTVEKAIPRVFNAGQGDALLKALAPAAQLLGVDHQQLMRHSAALQFVLVGRKAQ